jgi:hypothetical protein
MIRIDCRDISGDPGASTQIQLAHECLARNGYAILDHVLPEAKVRALNLEFQDCYGRYQQDQELDDTAKVGNRRFLMPLELSGGFGDPSIYANPIVVALVREALQPDAILEAYGAIISLPGSRQQHVHSDSPLLFTHQIAPLLPAYALNFGLPLVEMNERTGTTALFVGSHRRAERGAGATPEFPTIPAGSCILWDFRLHHYGTANQSDIARPLVYAAYVRPWYRDPVNYDKATQRRLNFEPAFLSTLSEDSRRLFAHVSPPPISGG